MIELPERRGAAVPQARLRPVRRGPVYRGLPRPVQALAWLALAAILGSVIGATLPEALRALGATAALAPGKLAWYGVRATGFLAYFAVAGSVIYGLLLSTKLLDAIAHRPVSFALHKDLALVGLALSGLHGLLLLGDGPPLAPDGKAGAASTEQAARLDHRDHVLAVSPRRQLAESGAVRLEAFGARSGGRSGQQAGFERHRHRRAPRPAAEGAAVVRSSTWRPGARSKSAVRAPGRWATLTTTR